MIKIQSYPGENEYKSMQISLVNGTSSKDEYLFDTSLFDCHLDIHIPIGELKKFELNLSSDDKKEPQSIIRANNCNAKYYEEYRRIITENFKRFDKERIVPIDEFYIENKKYRMAFKNLSDSKKLLESLDSFNNYLDIVTDKRKIVTEKSKALNQMVKLIQDGIETIKNDEDARKAFILMNLCFLRTMEYPHWHLFQIGYILSIVGNIVKGEDFKTVNILHVETGGGKSEAYFALAVFTAFYDRLRGKKVGVSGITKFPLRMLSIQQLQRIAKIFMNAEEVRKERKIPGDTFSVGYLVGHSKNFPNWLNNETVSLIRNEKARGRIINRCPINECSGEIKLLFDEEKLQIRHKCEKCDREYKLFFVDEEIYRFLPTFIVSTVDKHSAFSGQRKYRNIVGGGLSLCNKGHGYLPHGDKCDAGKKLNKKGCTDHGIEFKQELSTAPTLLIQDELHLVSNEFGTIDSHFETAIEEASKVMGNEKGFKNLAMTATIRGAHDQIKELYGKKAVLFPPFSPSEMDIFFKSTEITGRIFLGLTPNRRENRFATLLTIRYLFEILSESEKDDEKLCIDLNISPTNFERIIDSFRCNLVYLLKKHDTFSISYFFDDTINISVDGKKAKSRVLTGENNLAHISKVIEEIETFKKGKESNYHTTLATSVVSHGVDIDRWNFMIFQGMPRSTSEYIQSSSRAGRKRTGIILTWFYPNRLRDVSYYRFFEQYHAILENKVENIPIARFAPLALDQTITSILSGMIMNVESHLLKMPLYNLDNIKSNLDKDDIDEIKDLIIRFYRTDLNIPGGVEFEKTIPRHVDKRFKAFERYSKEKSYFPNHFGELRKSDPKKYHYFKNQSGMRGISDQLVIGLDGNDRKIFEKFKRRGIE